MEWAQTSAAVLPQFRRTKNSRIPTSTQMTRCLLGMQGPWQGHCGHALRAREMGGMDSTWLSVLSTGCGRIQQPELWPACAVHTQASARGLTAVPQPPSVAMHHNFSQRTLTCQTSASKQSRRLPCLFSSLPSANWCNSTRHSPAPRCNASSAQRYQIPSDRQLWCGHPQRTGISGTPRATRPEALSQVLP